MGMDVSELNVGWVESRCLALKDKKVFRKDRSEWYSGEGPWSGQETMLYVQFLSPELCPGLH